MAMLASHEPPDCGLRIADCGLRTPPRFMAAEQVRKEQGVLPARSLFPLGVPLHRSRRAAEGAFDRALDRITGQLALVGLGIFEVTASPLHFEIDFALLERSVFDHAGPPAPLRHRAGQVVTVKLQGDLRLETASGEGAGPFPRSLNARQASRFPGITARLTDTVGLDFPAAHIPFAFSGVTRRDRGFML